VRHGDRGETNNLAASQPDLLTAMLASLVATFRLFPLPCFAHFRSLVLIYAHTLDAQAKYEAENSPCCSCTLQPDMAEMALPPKDGVWYSFHDESDPTEDASPLCDLLREPPRNK